MGMSSLKIGTRIPTERIADLVRLSPRYLDEVLRVLNARGKFVCWPSLDDIGEYEGELRSRGYFIGREAVLGSETNLKLLQAFSSGNFEVGKYRTVISRNKKVF
jgi:hypothetical protein